MFYRFVRGPRIINYTLQMNSFMGLIPDINEHKPCLFVPMNFKLHGQSLNQLKIINKANDRTFQFHRS